MKKLTNDPSRNVNAVSGMWVRLRKDGSKYDVRYVNARVRRVWSLSQTSQGTAWNVQAKGVQYEDFLNGMKSSSVDLEHGWLLVPDSERCGIVRVPVPTGMDAKRVENALREVLKYYDEAGEAGENYELDPDNLSKFAADLCKEYSKS